LWPKTASWLRRLGEILTAIAISKLVIIVVLVLVRLPSRGRHLP